MDAEKGQGEVDEGMDPEREARIKEKVRRYAEQNKEKAPAYELSKHPTKPAPKMPDQSKVKPAPEFKEDDETKARKQKYYDEHPNALD